MSAKVSEEIAAISDIEQKSTIITKNYFATKEKVLQ